MGSLWTMFFEEYTGLTLGKLREMKLNYVIFHGTLKRIN